MDNSGSNSFNQLKQWVKSKLQLSDSDDTRSRYDTRQCNTMPRLRMSYSCHDSSSFFTGHSSASCNESHASDVYLCTPKVLQLSSEHVSPVVTPLSPDKTFHFLQELHKFENLDKSQLHVRSQQNFSDKAICTACGQTQPMSSVDARRFFSTNSLPLKQRYKTSGNGSSETVNESRRYKGALAASESQIFDRSDKMMRAASSKKVQRPGPIESKEQGKFIGLKEMGSYGKTSPSHSWSKIVGNIPVSRRETVRSNGEQLAGKIVCTGNEKVHKRSSLAPFNRSAGSYNDNPAEKRSKDTAVYSPALTRRAPLLVNGKPADDFRYIFESDSLKIPSIYGQIKIMFQFFNDNNRFVLSVLKGSNIAQRKDGTLGVYTKVCLLPGKHQTKKGTDKHDSQNPVFYEHFNFHVSLDQLLESELRIKLYNKPRIFSMSEPIGECTVPLFYYDLTAVSVIWQNLKKSKRQKDELEEFDFSIMECNYRSSQRRPRGFRGILCGTGKSSDKE